MKTLFPSFHGPAWLPMKWISMGFYRRCWRCRKWHPAFRYGESKGSKPSNTCDKCRIERPPTIKEAGP
jgi:hypothetical protein